MLLAARLNRYASSRVWDAKKLHRRYTHAVTSHRPDYRCWFISTASMVCSVRKAARLPGLVLINWTIWRPTAQAVVNGRCALALPMTPPRARSIAWRICSSGIVPTSGATAATPSENRRDTGGREPSYRRPKPSERPLRTVTTPRVSALTQPSDDPEL